MIDNLTISTTVEGAPGDVVTVETSWDDDTPVDGLHSYADPGHAERPRQ